MGQYTIQEAVNIIESTSLIYNDEAWQTLKAAVLAQQTNNTDGPKLLDKMERFAVECDNAGNGRDAREVRSWIKQLRASA